MTEERRMMPQGGELGDEAVLGAAEVEMATALIIVRIGTCTSEVVMYILRRIVTFSPELAVMAWPLPLGFSPVCPDPVILLRAWCAGRGASLSQERRIVALLDLEHLLHLPLPPRTVRRPSVPD
jgi:hypothetical protein